MGLRTQGKNVIPFPAFSLPSLRLLNDWLHFNSEAGNRFRKHYDAATRPYILRGPPCQPPDTPGPLLGKSWSRPRAAGGIPGAAGWGEEPAGSPHHRLGPFGPWPGVLPAGRKD